MSTEQDTRAILERKATIVGHIKVLSVALNYVWCVKASMDGSGLAEEKALEELKAAMGHINEAAHCMTLKLDAVNKRLGVAG